VSSDDFVVVLSLGDNTVWRHDVSNGVERLRLLNDSFSCNALLLSDLTVNAFRLSDLFLALVLALAIFLLLGNSFGDIILLFVEAVKGVFGFTANLVELNHLIDDFNIGESLSLRFFDNLGVTT